GASNRAAAEASCRRSRSPLSHRSVIGRSSSASRPLSPGLAGVEPRLEDRTGRRLVDGRTGLLASHLAGRERALRLNGREPLVPELDHAARAVGDELPEAPRVARRGPFAAPEVKGQADDEPPDVFAGRQVSNGRGERLGIARVERAPGVRQETKLVVDGHPDSSPARIEPALAGVTTR